MAAEKAYDILLYLPFYFVLHKNCLLLIIYC